MKNFAIIFTILLFSQMTQSQENNDSYKLLWKKVAQLEQEALTKSALEVVTSISKKAKKENNAAEIVKTLLYTSKYVIVLEEDSQLKIINDFKTEIEKAKFPTKNVLESYLANLYWQYFQNNRYQFYNRTKTEEKVNPIDFRTWDLTTLFNEINIHFDASLKNTSELQKISTLDFNEILHKQENSETYRPTLFDLLTHNALQFYKTNENSITRPADKFEIDNSKLLCEANQFIEQKIDVKDKTSLQSKALIIYQQLVKFHLNDKKLDAFAHVDIERLKYIHENAVFKNIDDYYLETLQNTVKKLQKLKVSALYSYEIALLYNAWGNTYQPKINEKHRWKQKEALELCDVVIAKFPKSKGAEKCKALKSRILNKILQLTGEQHIPINAPSKLLVNYKNHTGLNLTAYNISQSDIKKLNDLYPENKKLAFIKKLKIAKQWKTSIKNEKDYQTHSTEILVPELENGLYLIVATPTENNNNTFAYSKVQVTNLALVLSDTPSSQSFQIINRNNGKPIANAMLKFSYNINYTKPMVTTIKTSDKNGFVKISKPLDRWTNVNIQITTDNDNAQFGDYYIYRDYISSPIQNTQNTAFLFTDRSIYRPGQPLYFKGITVAKNNENSTVIANTEVAVLLKDVNNQEIGKQQFKTNEYGSFNGEFIIPNNGLTGEFHLQVSSESAHINNKSYFSVEEYKRPKFETSFEPVTKTYKLNDSILVTGKATAYAGSVISGAKVQYRVKRIVSFPRWCYWYYPNINSTPQEIAHGEVTTDTSGNYKISFKAIPDNTQDKANLPTFSYEVTADVTDINGETHSTTTVVKVGYHTLTASIQVSDKIDKIATNNKLTIYITNLNGEFTPAKGTLKIYKLKAPENVLRTRPWAAPDYTGFSKSEFKKFFPHDAYDNEHNATNWKKGTLALETNFDTGKSTEIKLEKLKKWLSGKYIIELETKDKFGQLVKDITYTTLYNNTDKKLADNQLFDIKTDQPQYAIGDKVNITLLSSSKNVTVTFFVEKNHKIVNTYFIHLNDNYKSITIPVTKEDLGGFAVTYSFSAYNSFQSGTLDISVPYPSTQLEIETITFRDKLQPGTDETWKFKIKGPEGDKVVSELLASMYDASLDAFKGHSWGFNPTYKPNYYTNFNNNAHQSFGATNFNVFNNHNDRYSYTTQGYDSFNWFGFYFENIRNHKLKRSLRGKLNGLQVVQKNSTPMAVAEMSIEEDSSNLDEVVIAGYAGEKKSDTTGLLSNIKTNSLTNKKETKLDAIHIRKNLQETAFFFPQLRTDKEGNVAFSFTTPEALTRWKLQLLTHTKDAKSALKTLSSVTQKELMVVPNTPRFLREGDEIVFSSKIANLTEKTLSGNVMLMLTNAVTGKEVSKEILSVNGEKSFEVTAKGNTNISWTLKIPKGIQAIQYKVIAKAGDFSDGEQNVLPVLTNRMLVTETLPMWVRSNQTKTFTLDKLVSTVLNDPNATLSNHKLSLEITSNPAWYAVQALPYLMEYPYECNEQTFSRYYANTLASHIANSNPRIQEVFNQWANSDALISNLEKNQELKSLLIQETPWLRDAQSETEQKKRIALLFNLNKMKNEQTTAINKLKNNQLSSGAWAWFNGGRKNRYITQHIITGFGHLKQLNVTSSAVDIFNNDTEQMIKKAVRYLDDEFVEEYNNMKKYTTNLNHDHLSNTQIHYLYMRSFFKDIKTSKKVDEITAYYKKQAQKYWSGRNLYTKGMLGLILNRMEDTNTANKIIKSLKENSITSDELGMYWKENTSSWYWYQAPIETQALLIEAFSEIENDTAIIDNLKIWLLKNKQTNQWKTTKATTEAVYALLLQGSNWLSVTDAVDVLVGGEKIAPSKLENVKVEAGTGYYKTSWNGSEIKPKMGQVQISKKGKGIAWGALYWQYFEDLDKITSAETPLKLKKKLFLKQNTDTGEEISEITSKTTLKVGDLIRVRIELRADRTMEFVHMKDMRASALEPINILSSYKWQDGLGYYESTKDASTNFFFDYLPKGVYVFEYDVRVNNAGDFSNGITTIQSMYAPEFSSHSEGVRINVK